MKRYSKEEYLKAAELGEVSMIDARHVVGLLDEARDVMKGKVNICHDCMYTFENAFCEKGYDITNSKKCGGKYYETIHRIL